MAKRGADRDLEEERTGNFVDIINGRIKGYQEYKIKLPIGARVEVVREREGVDEKALLCRVPEDLPERMLNTTMSSKSSRSSYLVRDVTGRTMGRMQYFLNTTVCDLLDEGRISLVEGFVTGEPRYCRRPPGHQAWVKDRQEGGGVATACTWRLHVASNANAENIAEEIRARLSHIEGGDAMEVKVLPMAKKPKTDQTDSRKM